MDCHLDMLRHAIVDSGGDVGVFVEAEGHGRTDIPRIFVPPCKAELLKSAPAIPPPSSREGVDSLSAGTDANTLTLWKVLVLPVTRDHGPRAQGTKDQGCTKQDEHDTQELHLDLWIVVSFLRSTRLRYDEYNPGSGRAKDRIPIVKLVTKILDRNSVV